MLITEPPGGRLVSGVQLAAPSSCACATELSVTNPKPKTMHITRAPIVLLMKFTFEIRNKGRFNLIAQLPNCSQGPGLPAPPIQAALGPLPIDESQAYGSLGEKPVSRKGCAKVAFSGQPFAGANLFGRTVDLRQTLGPGARGCAGRQMWLAGTPGRIGLAHAEVKRNFTPARMPGTINDGCEKRLQTVTAANGSVALRNP